MSAEPAPEGQHPGHTDLMISPEAIAAMDMEGSQSRLVPESEWRALDEMYEHLRADHPGTCSHLIELVAAVEQARGL